MVLGHFDENGGAFGVTAASRELLLQLREHH
jgi:hypothetical protein